MDGKKRGTWSRLALLSLFAGVLSSSCGTLLRDIAATPAEGAHTSSAQEVATPSSASASPGSRCALGDHWPDASAQFEAQVLVLVNQRRAAGASCGSEGRFGPKPALVADNTLTCIARAFAKDMADHHFFSHEDQSGRSPFDRMDAAGLNYSAAAENIAEGQQTPEEVVRSWISSDGHCANMMGDTQRTGIGFSGHVWVQDFATLRGGSDI